MSIARLHCKQTEDYTGKDDCHLKVYIDDIKKHDKSHRMNNGDDWDLYITEKVKDNTKIEVKLWDKDWPDKDDYLGSVTLIKECGIHEGKFTKDGANYTLSYDIKDNADLKLLDKLYVEHLPIDVKILGKVAEHTYLVAKKNDNIFSKHWAAFGRDSGGELLKDTMFNEENGIDYNTINYIMTEPPCIWPKYPYYAVVGVCWNACNRGLYFAHKTVHKIKFYSIVEGWFGTYGLDIDSICTRKISKKGRELYNWTKERKAIADNFPWHGKTFADALMIKSENPRIRLYHEYFGDVAKNENITLQAEDRWINYLQDLLKLHLKETLIKIEDERVDTLLDAHKTQFNLMHLEENNSNELLKVFKKHLNDEEYKLVFNADKTEIFHLPIE